jgi:hypothetical protein
LHKSLAANGFFEYISKVKPPKIAYISNDYTLQGIISSYALNTIKAPNAWDVSKGSSAVKLAIIDNGFDVNHEDLVNQIVFTDGNVSGGSHGTNTAGVAAAQTDNNKGMSSIGFNSKLMLYLFWDTYSSMMNASLGGAKVINCSFFTSCTPNQHEQDIINIVVANGTAIVASAANGNVDYNSSCGDVAYVYPASYDNVISVSGGVIADSYFNNNKHFTFNDKVDLTAPGYTVWATYNNNTYGSFSGTSASAPLVTGTIGLMLAAKSCLKPGAVEYILKTTADKSINNTTLHPENAPFVNTSGAGRLDAGAAVLFASQWPQSFINSATISGPSVICSTGTFSIPNYSSTYGDISWSSSNPSVLTIDPNTGAATRVGTSNGSVTITATINSSCGNSPVSLKKTVWLGVPMFTNVSNNGVPVAFGGTTANPYIVNANNIVEVDAIGSNGQINFTLGGSPYFVNGHADNSYIYEFICKYPNNNIYLSFYAGNSCGSNSGDIYFCNSNCTGGITSSTVRTGLSVTAFPNPVSNMLIVQMSDSLANGSTLNQPYQLLLFNRFSQTVYSIQSYDKNLQIPVSNLPADVYYLNVIYNGAVLREQIVVKR